MIKQYILTIENGLATSLETYDAKSFWDKTHAKEVEQIENTYKAQIDDLKEKLIASEANECLLRSEILKLRDRLSGLKTECYHNDDMVLKYMHENAELKRKLKYAKEYTTSMSNMFDELEVGLGK